MKLNNIELAAVKDCFKRYVDFNNYGLMSSYKVKQSNLLLMNEKEMTKILKKDIVRLCNCIQGLSYQTIRTSEKGAFNKGYIYTYTIYPYVNCVTFRFIENDHRTFNSYSKKFMFEQLLRYYKKGLNSWIELYNNDRFKAKRKKENELLY